VAPGESSTQAINRICFEANGFLFGEFSRLYNALFDRSGPHLQVIRTLSRHRGGLPCKELLEKAGLQSGGRTTTILDELEQAGFIAELPSFGLRKKNTLYRLIDEYSLFYLKWIESVPKNIFSGTDPNYWVKRASQSAWRAWSGYAFEGICLKHIQAIKAKLGIGAVTTAESGWVYQAQGPQDGGAQIDLVIDRADHCINLCEIKYFNAPWRLNKRDVEALLRKRSIFQEITQTRKTLFTTLITSYGAIASDPYTELAQSQVTMDDLFK
jgi:hypothetical protein